VKRLITAFHQDETGAWVADLECGHGQHVRHRPPWEVRPWVLAEASRQEKIGTALDCLICRAPFIYRGPMGDAR
jgi:hypothetical protein